MIIKAQVPTGEPVMIFLRSSSFNGSILSPLVFCYLFRYGQSGFALKDFIDTRFMGSPEQIADAAINRASLTYKK
jgi:hypothetical protein